jgi:hypothetical protein
MLDSLKKPSTKFHTAILFITVMTFLSLNSLDLLYKAQNTQKHENMHRRLSKNKASESFLGVPVTYRNSTSSFESTVHCVGDNFDWNTSWMHRSCQFRNLCYNTESKEFLIFLSPEEIELQIMLNAVNKFDDETISVSSIARNRLSFGTEKLSLGALRDLSITDPWFPTIVTESRKRNHHLSNGFYQLSENALLVPILLSSKHSLAWEDFFSIYTVLSMYGFEDRRLTLMHQGNGSDISTTILSTFGIQSSDVGQAHGSSPPSVIHEEGEHARSNLVCGRQGVAGQVLTHHISHGATMYSFRDYIFRNMGLSHIVSMPLTPSSSLNITIAFDGSSKDDWHESLRNNLEHRKTIAEFSIQNMDTRDQLRDILQWAAMSNVFISRPGSDVLLAAATCLPRGSTLIVLDKNDPTVMESADDTRKLERRYLEKSSYFNLHWIHTSPQEKTGPGIYEIVTDIVIGKMRR